MSDALVIHIDPVEGPLWLRRRITVDGATPGSMVTLKSTTLRNGIPWSASASYLADAEGRIDLDTQTPGFGDHRSPDAMGLIWAQQPEVDGASFDITTMPAIGEISTTITAREESATGYYDHPQTCASGRMASAVLVQGLREADVSREKLDAEGLHGTVFRPSGSGPYPTVIVMNGSGGGINEIRAAAYAAHGIQAVALGYFRSEGLSPYISNTALEYFEQALDYVQRNLDPLGKPALNGQSRGGELTLLLGSLYPEKIGALVAYTPSAFICGAQGAADPKEGWSGATWKLDGRPLEHLWHNNAGVTWNPWDGMQPPSRDRNIYIDGLHDRATASSSRIAIEHFTGPVLAVSGADDRLWPAGYSARLAFATLARHGHQSQRLHLDYPYAGHAIGMPFVPSTQIYKRHPVSGIDLSTGGTPQGNAEASADSFAQTCDFLIRSLAQTDTRESR